MMENMLATGNNTRSSGAMISSSQADEPGAMMEAEERDELNSIDDPIKKLYPFVDETKTPLPRFWNNGDKYNYLIVTNQNLRVTYRGAGKNHKDAAAVRANFPIPATCGIYYFEITIVSKGRDGYMGIGLSEKEVSLNRLPGWDRNSYGYHADDGNFFSSSGNGTQYGPTFTTNDVVGCGYNLIDNSIFYTKNGQNLGVAFHDVPSTEELYPTVGLQTPGEIVDTNFGQKPFVFNIQDEIKATEMRVQASIFNYQLPATKTEWMNKLVSSYLVHHGFCSTAESFNLTTNQRTVEDTASMTNRQQIQKLVLNGHIAEAIEMVEQIYPMLLHTNKPLLFMLKCRQFIEMLAQVTQEREPRSSSHHRSSPTCSPPYKLSKRPSPNDREHRLSPRRTTRSPRSHEDTPSSSGHISNGASHDEPMEDGVYTNGSAANGSSNNTAVKNGSQPDEEMG
uniref:Ran-binding protein 10 n=1 Tax=Plectus sambesii TaxID=2011161 RepID=A0A914WF27_9BILA